MKADFFLDNMLLFNCFLPVFILNCIYLRYNVCALCDHMVLVEALVKIDFVFRTKFKTKMHLKPIITLTIFNEIKFIQITPITIETSIRCHSN